MPPWSPRRSWNLVMPCVPTNSRIRFWLVAVLELSAGTRWSKTIAMRLGIPHARLDARARVDLVELVDHQRGVLVRHREVDARFDDVTDGHGGLVGRPGQDLLDDGHGSLSSLWAGRLRPVPTAYRLPPIAYRYSF